MNTYLQSVCSNIILLNEVLVNSINLDLGLTHLLMY